MAAILYPTLSLQPLYPRKKIFLYPTDNFMVAVRPTGPVVEIPTLGQIWPRGK